MTRAILVSKVESTHEDEERLVDMLLSYFETNGSLFELEAGSRWKSVMRVHSLSNELARMCVIDTDFDIVSWLVSTIAFRLLD